VGLCRHTKNGAESTTHVVTCCWGVGGASFCVGLCEAALPSMRGSNTMRCPPIVNIASVLLLLRTWPVSCLTGCCTWHGAATAHMLCVCCCFVGERLCLHAGQNNTQMVKNCMKIIWVTCGAICKQSTLHLSSCHTLATSCTQEHISPARS